MTLKPSERTPAGKIDVFVVGRREPPIEAAEASRRFPFLISTGRRNGSQPRGRG